MAQEATLVCVDNSEWMRNGDFIPTRLDAQGDAINMACRAKLRQNPENTVGLMSLADNNVLATLTTDVNKILTCLRVLQPQGSINFISGIRIAQLVLKHRQNKHQKMRIMIFIASPVEAETKQLERLAKRLKKEKVNVDVVIFGEQEFNEEVLTPFINIINGKEGTNSHLVVIKPGPILSDALASSPILRAEDGTSLAPVGTGFEFGIDPSEDPELAMAIRVSLEEQRQQQEEEARRVQEESVKGTDVHLPTMETGQGQSVLATALQTDLPTGGGITVTDGASGFDNLSEDEQMALAIQMSLQPPVEMEVEQTDSKEKSDSQDDETMDAEMEELLENRDFLESTFANLPGVDPDEVLQMMEKEKEDQKSTEESTNQQDKS